MTISGMSFINVTPELAFWCQVWLLMAANWAVKSKWAHYHVIVVTISRSDHIVQTVYCSACICEELMNELQIHSSRSAAAAVSEDSHHLIMCKKKKGYFLFSLQMIEYSLESETSPHSLNFRQILFQSATFVAKWIAFAKSTPLSLLELWPSANTPVH